jgi:hypothetical protein
MHRHHTDAFFALKENLTRLFSPKTHNNPPPPQQIQLVSGLAPDPRVSRAYFQGLQLCSCKEAPPGLFMHGAHAQYRGSAATPRSAAVLVLCLGGPILLSFDPNPKYSEDLIEVVAHDLVRCLFL